MQYLQIQDLIFIHTKSKLIEKKEIVTKGYKNECWLFEFVSNISYECSMHIHQQIHKK